jgi:hypothetical protein
MNESFNPQVAAEKVRDTLRQTAVQFEDFNTPVSEAMRARRTWLRRASSMSTHEEVFRRGGPRRDSSKP